MAKAAACFLVVFLPLLLVAQSPPEKTTLTEEDYAIYAAALQRLYSNDLYSNEKIDRILLMDQTGAGVPPGMAAVTRLGNENPAFYKNLTEDLKELGSRNKASAVIDSHKIDTKLEVLTLSVEEAKKIVDSGWEAFGKQYSRCRGITLLSLPALNAEKDRALLYVGFSCGIVCGDGRLLLAMKKDGKWSLKDETIVWVAAGGE